MRLNHSLAWILIDLKISKSFAGYVWPSGKVLESLDHEKHGRQEWNMELMPWNCLIPFFSICLEPPHKMAGQKGTSYPLCVCIGLRRRGVPGVLLCGRPCLPSVPGGTGSIPSHWGTGWGVGRWEWGMMMFYLHQEPGRRGFVNTDSTQCTWVCCKIGLWDLRSWKTCQSWLISAQISLPCFICCTGL